MGGVLFTSTQETLQSCPQSALASMFFKPSNPSAPGYYVDQSGAYFIDASPIVFRVILDWLRYRQLLFADRPHGSNFLTALRIEARDLGLPEMVQDIRRCEEEEMEKRKVAEERAMQLDRLRSQVQLKNREFKEFKKRKSLIEEKKNHLEESMMLAEGSRMKELWKRSAVMVEELEQFLPVGDVNKNLSGGYDNRTISAGDGLVVEDNSSTSDDDENDETMKRPIGASGIGSVSAVVWSFLLNSFLFQNASPLVLLLAPRRAGCPGQARRCCSRPRRLNSSLGRPISMRPSGRSSGAP